MIIDFKFFKFHDVTYAWSIQPSTQALDLQRQEDRRWMMINDDEWWSDNDEWWMMMNKSNFLHDYCDKNVIFDNKEMNVNDTGNQ